jgi:hypothetical protein
MKTHTSKYYLTRDGQEYKLELYYSKGGVNYFSGSNIDRGYYVSVVPVTRKFNPYNLGAKVEGDGYWSETFIMFNGCKRFIESCRAFSQKRYDTLANDWVNMYQPLFDDMINFCVEKGWTTEKVEHA